MKVGDFPSKQHKTHHNTNNTPSGATPAHYLFFAKFTKKRLSIEKKAVNLHA